MYAAKRIALGTELLASKRPAFDHNADVDLGVFGAAFDFFVARSIWTHMPPSLVQRTLDQACAHGTANAQLFASYWPEPDADAALAWIPQAGAVLRGEALDPTERRFLPFVTYRFETIAGWCRDRGLVVVELHDAPRINNQAWLRIARAD